MSDRPISPESRSFLLEHSLPAVQVESGGARESAFYPNPRVPEGFEWPMAGEVPYGLVFHMDLAEVAAAHAFDWLPKEGTLLIFLDADRIMDPDAFVVRYVPVGARWVSIKNPSDIPFSEFRAKFKQVITLEAYDVLQAAHGFADADAHMALEAEFLGEYEVHQIGGHETVLQSKCEPLPAEEGPWQLLFQLDSDEEHKTDWVDRGRFFVYVPERRARVGDFSVVWSELQFY